MMPPDPVRLIDHASFEGLAEFEKSGELIGFNPKMEELIGIRRETIRSLSQFIEAVFGDGHDGAANSERFDRMLGGLHDDAPFRIDIRGGQAKWCRFAVSSHEDGKRVVCCIDVTKETCAFECLQQSERQFRTLFEESKDAISFFYRDGERLVNHAWLEMFGYTEEESRSLDIMTLYVNPEDRRRFERELDDRGFIRNFEVDLVRKDGRVINCNSTARAHKDEDGRTEYYQGIIRDITPMKQMIANLRDSEEKYRTLFETSTDAIGITDVNRRFVGVNQSWLDLFGYTREEVIGSDPALIYASHEEGMRSHEEMGLHGFVRDFEARFRRKDGSIIDGLSTISAWRNNEGTVIGYQGVVRDITARKKTERALQYRADFQQLVSSISTKFINLPVDRIDDGIVYTLKTLAEFEGVDRGYVLLCKDNWSNIVLSHEWCADGISPHRVMLTNVDEKSLEWVRSRLERLEIVNVKRVADLPQETRKLKSIAEKNHVISFIAVPMVYAGNLIGIFGFESVRVARDWNAASLSLLRLVGQMLVNAIERKSVEKRIVEYQEKLRSIASELTLTEERERRRIAVELHDRIGQTLAVANMKLGALRGNIKTPVDLKTLGEISAFIEDAIRDTRSLIFEISPPVLYDLGFEAAVEWLLETIRQSHDIDARFHTDGLEKPLTDNMRVLLFQTVRELLMNVIKHARARTVTVTSRRKEQSVDIEVEDNGIGFDAHSIGTSESGDTGFGLFSIRERFDHFGGKFLIESTPGRGTRVLLSVPVSSLDSNGGEHQ
jgi:PAS domain S-box-containing protein